VRSCAIFSRCLDIIRGLNTLIFLLAEHNYTTRLCGGLKHVDILFIIMQKFELLKLLYYLNVSSDIIRSKNNLQSSSLRVTEPFKWRSYYIN
jgi:hypothetical protein